MQLLDGKLVADLHQEKLRVRAAEYRKTTGKSPGLAVVLIGDDPASRIYVKNKEAACERVGIVSTRYDLDKKTNVEELDSLLNRLNADHDVHGVLVQIPIPAPFKYETVLEQLNPLKDADGLTYQNLGLLLAGRPLVKPCTPNGIMVLLNHYKIDVAGKRAVVIGRSNIVGKPMAQLLLEANATVTVCHSKTKDVESYTREADIVVVAAGQPRFIGGKAFKKGAVVVDVGMHRDANNKLCGDVRFEELEGVASFATPVPKGVGPMTITMLLHNTLMLAELSHKK
jgi:methylenetetrahydrofolate dehydrogenase (NADP+)/methenyltetrahydrofolate cyclohydrolase